DIEAIKQLKARYVRLLDAQDWAQWADTLADDFTMAMEQGVFEGRDRVLEMVQQSMGNGSSVHRIFPPEISMTGPDGAEATWPMEEWITTDFGRGPRSYHNCGHYEDRYTRTELGWRLSQTTLTMVSSERIDTAP